MGVTKATKAEKAQAVERLREWIKPGDTVYTRLHHTSRSGMQREISIVLITCEDGKPVIMYPNWHASKALEMRQGKHGGLIIGGAGMDMGFAIVYALSHALYGAGFGCIGKGCPSADHNNGDRDYTPHYDGTPRDASEVGKDLVPYQHYHTGGGYVLRHQWL